MEIERWKSGSDPSISVVLPTIPSTDHSDVVEKLKDQSFAGEWEILVVVDDEPTDRRCEARNIGLREAEADIVAHTDDDVAPPEDWIEKVYAAFESDVVCVEGRVTGSMDYNGIGLYRGCNMAVRRDEALRVGGWNEEFVGWRDDTEFGWRLEEEGNGRCIYEDSVVMIHPPEPRTQPNIDQEIKLYNMYPSKYKERTDQNFKKQIFVLLNKYEHGQRLLKALF